jgi:prepilin-type processing-associated H-X9-DG protein
VRRPAETALVSDGATMSFLMGPSPNRRILSSFGCQGMLMHQEGANYVFLDGHAKHLKGNPERVVDVKNTPTGPFYYMRYMSYDID